MIDIVHVDAHLLVANKPANLLSVPGKTARPNLLDLLRRRYPNIRLVHRLDMATSGLILFAQNHGAQRHLSSQFEQRTVRKVYSAVVQGTMSADCGEVELPLACDWPNRPKQHINWATGKPARTFFRVQSRTQVTTRLTLTPVTGRSHQLRVHCMAIGHPIVGDSFYGGAPEGARLKLHASELAFEHPVTREGLTFVSPPPFGEDETDLDQPALAAL